MCPDLSICFAAGGSWPDTPAWQLMGDKVCLIGQNQAKTKPKKSHLTVAFFDEPSRSRAHAA
jgi:hypothetical protein